MTGERHAAKHHTHEQEHQMTGERHAAKHQTHEQEHHMTDDSHDSQEEIEEHDIEGLQEKGWFNFLHKPANVRRNILETNIIHYVSQYGRIIGEIMRTKRTSKDVVAREKTGVRLFRDCVLSNADNARNGSSNCCAIGGLEDVRFQECSSLSRMLYKNLTALRTMEDDEDGEKYNDFVKRNLSDNQMQKIWNFGQSVGKRIFINMMLALLIRALQLDLLESVAQSMGFSLKEQKYIKKLIEAWNVAGGHVNEKIQQAIDALFGKKQEQGWTVQKLLEAGMALGKSFEKQQREILKSAERAVPIVHPIRRAYR